jgi:GMP synthase (glutamine-hydrolysing)
MSEEKVVILDFGSQYTQLIARRARELNIYSEILPRSTSAQELQKSSPRAIILSGGPASITEKESAPSCEKGIFDLGIPLLGICYGLQLMADLLGGEVAPSPSREYGKAELLIDDKSDLFQGVEGKTTAWMSHGDKVVKLPSGFEVIAHTANSPFAALRNKEKRLFGVQFHPEVIHTVEGKRILANFLYSVAGCSGSWTMASFIARATGQIKEKVGKEKVICALSGGVDSSCLAFLIHKAIGDQLISIFVDNGLLRKEEAKLVKETFKDHLHLNLRYVESGERFLGRLKGILDPEKKRRLIGNEFIAVFEEEARKAGRVKFLAQGTLYPDVIESTSPRGGPSATIKTHHNVGGLPRRMNLELIEPGCNCA